MRRESAPSRRMTRIVGCVVVLCVSTGCPVTTREHAASAGEAVPKETPDKTADAREANPRRVERWGIFELSLEGPSEGNPFLDVKLSALFTHSDRQGDRVFEPDGFYDGDGVYRVRFMPDALGAWSYVTESNRPELDGKKGGFVCVRPSPGNHGPVSVRNTYYFAYADGTPYFQVGTTCYTWTHRGDELEEQTLATLKDSPFNKLRFGVFPNHYGRPASSPEPVCYPFEGKPPRNWDFARYNPEYFRQFERRVGDLRDLGIEADVILFHPYDRWGFASLGAEADDRYLRYVVARLAAYRNVWWSMANEFDLVKTKKEADWDRFFRIVRDEDPYGRLRSIHNCRRWYDHTKPWVTHCSVQSSNFRVAREWRQKYRKPIIYDECKYEGDPKGPGWGRLSGRQMTNLFWLGAVAGCYVGHSEIKLHPEDLVWVTRGYVLRGESPPRIAFFKKIMEEGPPFEDMEPVKLGRGGGALVIPGEYYLVYFTGTGRASLTLTGTRPYKIDGIDTWNMTVTPLDNAEPGEFSLPLITTAAASPCVLRLTPYAPGEKLRPPQVRIETFTATPGTTREGRSSALSWKVLNSTSVELDGILVRPEGSKRVSPAKTTNYTLTARGEGGPNSREVTVTVVDPDALHLRINFGPALGDVRGWEPDDAYVSSGEDFTFRGSPKTQGVTNAAPPEVYRTCRHFDPSFTFPQVPDGTYLVRFHFYDEYGDRLMKIAVEGKTVLSDFGFPAGTAVVKDVPKTRVSGGDGMQIVFAHLRGVDSFCSGVEIIGGGASE